MYVAFSWLKEFVDLDCDINEFVEKMTMSGTKVETVKKIGDKIDSIITGKILEIKNHPNADKLVVTKVDIGEKILQIVTAAKNIFVGAIVPVAIHNSTLADGTKIKKSKLRGELSEGMFCSIEELGFNKSQYPESPDSGIYIFNDNVEIGQDVRPILELTEDVIDFEITSNRPDCLSILGIAREAAATFNKQLKYPVCENLSIGTSNFDIEIKDNNLCKRYMAQEIEDIKIEPSPQWMRHRLISCGINPINNIVDITNYIMLETGQPLHAFDAENISQNKIIVRTSKNESITTLDDAVRNLDNEMLVISDPEKILAIAGVMGGQSSKINSDTKKILIESANFDAYNIRCTSKKLKLRTDASMRYEKCIDPNLTEFAMARVIYLIKKLNCGKISSQTLDIYPVKKMSRQIKLNPDKINQLLGTNISEQEMIQILNKIELKTQNNLIEIPTFRNDIENDADIAEEVLRFYGYDKINSTLPATNTIGKKNKSQIINDKIKEIMIAQGGYEIKSFSFESPKVFEKCLMENQDAVKISNPLGEEFSIMRTNTINSMMQALSLNFNKKNYEAILFELGKVYEKNNNDLPIEHQILTIGTYGKINFFNIKGVIEKLFSKLKINNYDFKIGQEKFLHPYRQTKIFIGENEIGFLGEVHPKVTKNYDIKSKVCIATINLKHVYENTIFIKKFKPLAKFPAVYRDICVIADKDISAKNLSDTIYKCSTDILEDVKLFDVYEGKQIEDGKKSLAYKLIFRSNSKTLTEDEINSVMKKIIEQLENKFGATLRI